MPESLIRARVRALTAIKFAYAPACASMAGPASRCGVGGERCGVTNNGANYNKRAARRPRCGENVSARSRRSLFEQDSTAQAPDGAGAAQVIAVRHAAAWAHPPRRHNERRLVTLEQKKSATLRGCAKVPPKEEDLEERVNTRREHQHGPIMPPAELGINYFVLLCGRDLFASRTNKTNLKQLKICSRANLPNDQDRHFGVREHLARLAAEQDRRQPFTAV